MAEREWQLPDYMERAFAKGLPVIIQGIPYLNAEEVPAKWRQVPGGTAQAEDWFATRAKLKLAAEERAKRLGRLNQTDLATQAAEYGLPTHGTKAVLIGRILAAEGLEQVGETPAVVEG